MNREREQAKMRLKNARHTLKQLQRRLKRHGHKPDELYYRTMLQQFWEKLRYDKRIANGEI